MKSAIEANFIRRFWLSLAFYVAITKPLLRGAGDVIMHILNLLKMICVLLYRLHFKEVFSVSHKEIQGGISLVTKVQEIFGSEMSLERIYQTIRTFMSSYLPQSMKNASLLWRMKFDSLINDFSP